MSEPSAEAVVVEEQGPQIVWLGQAWSVPERINQRLVYRFMAAGAKGVTTDQAEGALLMERMIGQCVAPQDVDRFEQVCDEHRVSDEELVEFLAEQIKAEAGRPTLRSSDSSAGPRSTPVSSAADSSSQVIASLEAKGRPDLALVVLETQEWKAQQRSA